MYWEKITNKYATKIYKIANFYFTKICKYLQVFETEGLEFQICSFHLHFFSQYLSFFSSSMSIYLFRFECK